MTRDYCLFGLRVRSELALPELFPGNRTGSPDVTITLGRIEGGSRDAGLHIVDGAVMFVAPDAGRYRIANGTDILVEPKEGVPDRNVRLYLLGSAFGALLHQRGLLPLHANAVEIGGRAFAFMAAQGEGKSTLAAWFHDQGHALVADDVCVVRFDKGSPMVLPGLPRLRLWEDAIGHLGRDLAGLERSYVGDQEWNKYDLAVARERASSSDLPLGAVYLIERGDDLAVLQLEGVTAAKALFDHTYRGGYLDAANGQKRHWQSIVDLVRAAPVFRLTRKRGFDLFDRQAGAVRDHAASLSPSRVAAE